MFLCSWTRPNLSKPAPRDMTSRQSKAHIMTDTTYLVFVLTQHRPSEGRHPMYNRPYRCYVHEWFCKENKTVGRKRAAHRTWCGEGRQDLRACYYALASHLTWSAEAKQATACEETGRTHKQECGLLRVRIRSRTPRAAAFFKEPTSLPKDSSRSPCVGAAPDSRAAIPRFARLH